MVHLTPDNTNQYMLNFVHMGHHYVIGDFPTWTDLEIAQEVLENELGIDNHDAIRLRYGASIKRISADERNGISKETRLMCFKSLLGTWKQTKQDIADGTYNKEFMK